MAGSGGIGALERVQSAYLRFRRGICSPLAAIALASSQRDVIRADAARWVDYCGAGCVGDGMSERDVVATLLAIAPAYRNLLYYRLGHGADARMGLLVPLLRRIWKPLASLRLGPDALGPGCFILHGRETGVVAKSIGSDFVVGQHVIIGFTAPGKYPTIGDGVTISVGAIVIGDVTIGDHVTVGAGAVVVSDVPDGETVVGVPARPVSRHA